MKSLTGRVQQLTEVFARCAGLAKQPQETKTYLERVLFWGFDTLCDFCWACMCLMFWLLVAGSSHAGHELSANEFSDFIVAAYGWVTAGLR
jgi:hypothetical protein